MTRRPSIIPGANSFSSYEARSSSEPLSYEGWTIIASNEKELIGEYFKQKKTISSSITLTVNEKKERNKQVYATYLFRADMYLDESLENVPFDLPICRLEIVDTLERCNILYVSPYVIKSLDLIIDSNIHTGFQALNSSGEVIIKLLTWRNRYYGKINDGTEVPSVEGVAVIVRSDYYSRILELYENRLCFILSQKNSDDKESD